MAEAALETAGEIELVAELKLRGDLLDRVPALVQQRGSSVNPRIEVKTAGRKSHRTSELLAERLVENLSFFVTSAGSMPFTPSCVASISHAVLSQSLTGAGVSSAGVSLPARSFADDGDETLPDALMNAGEAFAPFQAFQLTDAAKRQALHYGYTLEDTLSWVFSSAKQY